MVDAVTILSKTIATLGWSPSTSLALQLQGLGFAIEKIAISDAISEKETRKTFGIVVASLQIAQKIELHKKLKHRLPQPALLLLANEPVDDVTLTELSDCNLQLFEGAVSDSQLLLALRDAACRQQRVLELNVAREETAFEGIVATSPQMTAIFEVIEKVSMFATTVLIRGESGTGKELVARAIHTRSPRANKPFIAINCGAIPENLLESELFGHKKGAFTDASRDKRGLFVEANHGTILLDEIGELPIHLQVKLLRVLQEQAIHPVGAPEPIPVDIRILAATLRDLESDVDDGRFRDDLFYRLNVVPITIPPLRERPDDILALSQHFLVKHRIKLGLPVYAISAEVESLLLRYPWPGNIRELENTLERAMILARGETIQVENLSDKIRSISSGAEDSFTTGLDAENLSIKAHARQLEEVLIRKALVKTKGNRTHAAKLLAISHRALLYKLKEYEIGE